MSSARAKFDRFETHEHDVLVIGAGGAGLRAAIEALAQGVSVGVVSKSLLGKAHTVMAEGGIAAAMANVDSADGWKPHFRDTMRGGKMLNNWRMAQLHAQEAPDRVRELEHWGAIFDRTARRKYFAARLRRAHLQTAVSRRRSHRPRNDSHAAGSRRAAGLRRLHGMHDRAPAQGRQSLLPAQSAIGASKAASSFSKRSRS